MNEKMSKRRIQIRELQKQEFENESCQPQINHHLKRRVHWWLIKGHRVNGFSLPGALFLARPCLGLQEESVPSGIHSLFMDFLYSWGYPVTRNPCPWSLFSPSGRHVWWILQNNRQEIHQHAPVSHILELISKRLKEELKDCENLV